MSSNIEEFSNFANLPTEIMFQIISYLNFWDQDAISKTCKRWFQASNEYFSKLQIHLSKVCLSDDGEPGEIFIKSNRPFRSLYLNDVVLCQADEFFNIIGKSIQKVSFISIDMNEKQFCSILSQFNYLTDLTIEHNSSLFMSGQFLESEQSQNLIKPQMHNLKRISLKNNSYLSDAILMRIINLTSNLKYMDLSMCHIACHNAIQKRFYPPCLENIPSESLLTLKYVLKALETKANTINDLDLSDTLVDGVALSQLAAINHLKLKRIVLISCRQLNVNGLEDFVTRQCNLIELDLSNCEGISDRCIAILGVGLSQLEILRLKHCWKLTDNSTKVFALMKTLKILDLSNCIGISSNGILENLVHEKNEILHELYLTSIDLYENCVVQCAEKLPNLRVFDIGHCCNGVTDKALAAIIKNQIWLRNLNLHSCHLITDAAITGCDLEELVVANSSNNEDSVDNITKSNFLFPSVKTLKISLRSKAEQQIVEEARRAKTMLTLLNKNICVNIGAESKPLSYLKGLKTLNISGCTKVSDISLKYGLKFHELRNLDISNCQQISNRGIEYLVENCKAIETLDLSYCRNIDQNAVDIINSKLKRLKMLNLDGCVLD